MLQQLLREQFPGITGLLVPVTVKFKKFYPVPGSSILILFTSSHWETFTNIDGSFRIQQDSAWFIYDG